MEAKVKWIDGARFVAESASGHQVVMDGNQAKTGPSPMEMVLMSAGTCSAIDVVSFLEKGDQAITGCEVKLTSLRRDEAPRLFTKINLHFIVTGRGLTDQEVGRAVSLSAEKYGSVVLMLGQAVEITYSHEIISS